MVSGEGHGVFAYYIHGSLGSTPVPIVRHVDGLMLVPKHGGSCHVCVRYGGSCHVCV